jgi:hypothetical protein
MRTLSGDEGRGTAEFYKADGNYTGKHAANATLTAMLRGVTGYWGVPPWHKPLTYN